MLNFTCKFRIPTKDFRSYEEKELTVHIIIKDSHLFFVLTIPSYIFNKVFSTDKKYLDSFIEKNYISPVLDRKTRFRNKLKSEVFQDLVGRFEEICTDAVHVQTVIDSEKEKVILVKFLKEDTVEQDALNHAYKGRKLSSRFQYFVCYQRTYKDLTGKTKHRYESWESTDAIGFHKDKGYGFKTHYDDVEEEFNIIKWTQEREDFFKNIEASFIKLNDKLDEFFGQLTAKKVEKLISLQKQTNLLPAYEENKVKK